jgi:UDP-GlcNAc:undecaprenyl-phosphate GlcNAc-1-phosphate transferase
LASISIAQTKLASNLFAVLGVPILLLLLPILDTFLVTITRLIRGQSPVQGGSDHTSHRLVAFGLTERQSVLVLYAIAIISGVAGTTLETLDYALSLVLIPILLVSLALLAAYLGRLKVVPTYSAAPRGAITRLVVELTIRRRLLEVMLDFILIGIAYYLAFWTRAGFTLDDTQLDLIFRTLPLAVGGVYVAYFLFRVYRGVWRYAGVDELLRYAFASIGGAALVYLALRILSSSQLIPLPTFFLFAVFLLFSLVASRFSFRVLDRIYGRQQVRTQEESSILICGAGDAGEMALRWILMNPNLGYRPVGFLDSDPFKRGRQIHGVDVLGDFENIEEILEKQKVDGLILTSDESATTPNSLVRALGVSRERGVWVRRLRFEFELLE